MIFFETLAGVEAKETFTVPLHSLTMRITSRVHVKDFVETQSIYITLNTYRVS